MRRCTVDKYSPARGACEKLEKSGQAFILCNHELYLAHSKWIPKTMAEVASITDT